MRSALSRHSLPGQQGPPEGSQPRRVSIYTCRKEAHGTAILPSFCLACSLRESAYLSHLSHSYIQKGHLLAALSVVGKSWKIFMLACLNIDVVIRILQCLIYR